MALSLDFIVHAGYKPFSWLFDSVTMVYSWTVDLSSGRLLTDSHYWALPLKMDIVCGFFFCNGYKWSIYLWNFEGSMETYKNTL